MSKNKNLVWLIPDGVRTISYRDAMGRFECFEDIKKDGFVEFKNMYTTAPSTFMSFTAFLSGVYSTKMADKYGLIKSLKYEIPTINHIFDNQGINNYFFTWHADLKAQLNTYNVVNLVDNKEEFLNGHFNYDDTSIDAEYIKDIIKNGLKEPFCLFIHMAAKPFINPLEELNYDFNTEFNDMYQLIKDNVNIDNTMFIIHSDHGFPIYTENIGKDYLFSHDELITQDNIKVPFFIKIPNKLTTKEDIYTPSSLIDVMPTIASVFNFKLSKYCEGENLIDIINGINPDRFIRIDNRFPTQANSKTVVIKDNNKVVYNRDTNKYSLFKINDDTKEEEISITQDWIEQFKKLDNKLIDERNKIFHMITNKKKLRIEDLLANKILYIRFDQENKYISEFITKYKILDSVITNFSSSIIKEYDLVCLLVENLFSLNPIIYKDKLSLLNTIYNNHLYIIDSYHNLEIIDKKQLTQFFENKYKIFQRKTARDMRFRNVRKEKEEEYYKLWVEKNK